MSLGDGVKKGVWTALGGTLPPQGIERVFAMQHELEASGTPAQATVLEQQGGWTHKYTRRREGGKPFDTVSDVVKSYYLTLRVQPESEPGFEVDRGQFLTGLPAMYGGSLTGFIIAVLFDRNDHSRIVLDERYEALAAIARLNEDKLPKDLSETRVREQWSLAHGDTMNQRLEAIRDQALRAPPAAGPQARSDPATELKKLAELHAGGALTDEEFATARVRVLDQI
jgi:hypothetical protein